jgi:hypothetical protein
MITLFINFSSEMMSLQNQMRKIIISLQTTMVTPTAMPTTVPAIQIPLLMHKTLKNA